MPLSGAGGAMILLMRALLPFFALTLAAVAQDRLPTLYVIGDSTANNADHRGWADPFAAYFDPAKIHVVNRARAGRSSRTFVTEGLWDDVRDSLQARRLRPHPVRP